MTRRTGWGLAVLWPLLASSGHADELATRPAIKTNRWQEDWSVLSDPALRVRGVEGLRIIDTSIMPAIPSGNTNGPTMAMAWRAADIILRDAPQTKAG